jgi:hypothetical protein
MRYEAGEDVPQRHPVVVGNANFMTPLAIETWCLEVCDGTWRLEADDQWITLSFEQNADITLFYMSRYTALIRR